MRMHTENNSLVHLSDRTREGWGILDSDVFNSDEENVIWFIQHHIMNFKDSTRYV